MTDDPFHVPLAATSLSPLSTIFGGTEVASITGASNHTAHDWVADQKGLYHTTTDLAAEWKGYYARMQAGDTTLTGIQRLEGNAEAVFENTGLAKLSTAVQARDREDAQREFDAIGAAMQKAGLSQTAPLTEHDYIVLGRALQSDPILEELALQGHGLNNSGIAKYAGYTNDFQHNVDNRTLFIGGGLDHNEAAIAAVFDDQILSHLPFTVEIHNGQLIQMNQNGAREDTLHDATVALDDTMFFHVFQASDFSVKPAPASAASAHYVSPAEALVQHIVPNATTTIFGDAIPTGPQTLNGHTWIADANGLYHTTANLAAEWQGLHQMVLDGHSSQLTAIQRLEANAEVVFEQTHLSKLDAATQQRDREDVQRELDAIAEAMRLNQVNLGIDPTQPLTKATYIALQQTLQGNALLEEMALQGHGLNNSGLAKYAGYTNDFQHGVDGSTIYVGHGPDSHEKALKSFMDDVILSHLPFGDVIHNGHVIQLNQNGARETGLGHAVAAFNFAISHDLATKDFVSRHKGKAK
jgi:hypothetical protein